MLPGTKKTVKVARLLTEGEPQFLSFVGHGANQTPFKVVKHAEGEDITEVTEIVSKETVDATQTAITRPNSKQLQFQSVAFDKTKFDQTRSKEFMTTMGFGQYNMEETDLAFVAKSLEFDKFITEGDYAVKKIDGHTPGVVFTIGVPTEMTEETTVEKSEAVKHVLIKGLDNKQLVEKFDVWTAYYSSKNTLGGVLADGMWDGLPPGFDEISVAYMTAIGNAVLDGDTTAIKTITTELGGLLSDIVNVFNKYVNDGKLESQKMTDVLKEVVKKTEAGTEPATTEEPKTTETEAPKTDDVPATEPKVEEPVAPKEEPATTEEPKVEPEVQKAADPSLADLLAAINNVNQNVDAVKKENAELSAKLDKSEERLKTLEGTATQPKGAATTQEEAKKTAASDAGKETSKKAFQADPDLAKVMDI